MITRPLIVPVSTLLASVNLPKDVRVASYGISSRNAPLTSVLRSGRRLRFTTQVEPEESQGVVPTVESIVIHLESEEFKSEDEGKPLVQGLG